VIWIFATVVLLLLVSSPGFRQFALISVGALVVVGIVVMAILK
jgi:hypothetical protein